MCILMCMLNKRVQILFEEHVWENLNKLARAKDTSISSLIRDAVEKKYVLEIELEKRRKAVEAILRHRPTPVKGKIDYKALINAGRKYY